MIIKIVDTVECLCVWMAIGKKILVNLNQEIFDLNFINKFQTAKLKMSEIFSFLDRDRNQPTKHKHRSN